MTGRGVKQRLPAVVPPLAMALGLGRGALYPDSHQSENVAMKSLRKFLVSEDGPTAVEYAVMLSLIVIVCLSAISTIGTNANSKFRQIASSLH